jgi:hypothetical protein
MPRWSSRSLPSPVALPQRRRRVFVLGLLLLAGLVLVACGSSESSATLDAGKVERAIERSSLAQRGVRPKVSCPAEIAQEKGLVFSCTAVAKGIGTNFVVTQLDDAGHVRYEAPRG